MQHPKFAVSLTWVSYRSKSLLKNCFPIRFINGQPLKLVHVLADSPGQPCLWFQRPLKGTPQGQIKRRTKRLAHGRHTHFLVLRFPFFPGILLSRKPLETQGNGRFLKRTMVGKNGGSTLRHVAWRFRREARPCSRPC